MTWEEVTARPSVVKDETEIGAQNFFSDSNRIRFVRGKPRKLGGWEKHITATTYTGLTRGLMGWTDYANARWLLGGSACKLEVFQENTLHNITPQRTTSPASGSLGTDPFAVTSGSKTVTVTHTAHNVLTNSYAEFDGASAGGGITIDGNYEVKSVINPNSYTIEHSSAASSTDSTTGGASVTFVYELECGQVDTAKGIGYGVGPYGEGTYGTARADGSFVLFPARVWKIERWGQNAVMAPIDGSIYEWQRNTGARATILSNAPTPNKSILVTNEQHLVAIGAGGSDMLVQWSDQSDNNNWTVSDLTTAGSRLLLGGSNLVSGIAARNLNLIFADGSLHSMDFIGGQDVFAFDQIASGAVGLIAPMAVCENLDIVYWMGQGDFFMYDGRVRPMTNSKDGRRFVFDNITPLQIGKCHCFVNSQFSEIWFFYPSTDGVEIDKYAKYTITEGGWDFGSLVRTSGIDRGVFDNPLLTDGAKYVQKHESGDDDDGSAMNEYATLAPVSFKNLAGVFDIMGIIPDFKDVSGSIDLTLLVRYYPQDTEEQISLTAFTSTTDFVEAHAEGRQASLKMGTSAIGTKWRLGTLHYDVIPAGNR